MTRTTDPALKEKGLTKVGTVFVIDAEKPVLAKWKETRASFAAYAAMSDQQTANQQLADRASQLEENRANLQSQLEDLNLRIGDQGSTGGNNSPGGFGGGGFPGRSFPSPLIGERNQIKAMLAEVTAEQKTLKNQSPQAKDNASLDNRVKRAEETFKAALGELRTQMDEVKKKYTDLEADPVVKPVLADAKKANPKLRIGPSDSFNSASKELDKAEQRFLGKKATVVSKKKTRTKK